MNNFKTATSTQPEASLDKEWELITENHKEVDGKIKENLRGFSGS